jgi:alcohol dehydrogenase (cytochrome c)
VKHHTMLVLVGVVAAGIGAMAALYFTHPVQVGAVAGAARSTVLSFNEPASTVKAEINPQYKAAAAAQSPAPAAPAAAAADWPSYNKTLTTQRYSELSQINRNNVGQLKVLCTYDTKQYAAFESGLLMVEGALIGTTEFDIFSIDPANCQQNWRTHEEYPPAVLSANRGAAYLDGMLFRGLNDGRVAAYDFKTGKRVWEATIADINKGETVPAAPIAWNGLVYIGNAGGDFKGGKGHMFALDAKTGKVVWEFLVVPKEEGDLIRGPLGASPLDASTWKNPPGSPISGGGQWTSFSLDPDSGLLYVPVGNPAPDFAIDVREGENLYTDSVVVLDAKTGAYKNHFKLVPRDWHDWDASNPPALIRTMGGKRLMAEAPKDGHLYGYDLDTNKLLYRVPVTRIDNVEEAFSPDKDVHFCPGAGGGTEWNSPAYDPRTNLIFVGDVDWCVTVRVQSKEELLKVASGQPWFGNHMLNPFDIAGKFSTPDKDWAGWVHAVDADTGVWKWRLKSDYPIVAAVTPTAGGLVFFGNVGGDLYAVNSETGEKLWAQKLAGPLGGGVITYSVNGAQKVAVATGLVNALWPIPVRTAKIAILGLEGDGASH